MHNAKDVDKRDITPEFFYRQKFIYNQISLL